MQLFAGNVGTFRNQGAIDMRGLETQVLVNLNASTKLMLNYANLENYPNNIKANRVNAISNATPREISSLLLTPRLDSNWDANFATYYTSAVHALGDGNPVDRMHRFDARLARKFNLSSVSGECSLNIQNLTDHHDQEYARYNELRRRTFLNVTQDF